MMKEIKPDLYNNKNIILNQIQINNDGQISFKEVRPLFSSSQLSKRALTLDSNNKLIWDSYIQSIKPGSDINIINNDGNLIIDLSLNLFKSNRLKGTNIYHQDNRIGVGRSPLHRYVLDIAIPENKLMTAFHIGDGRSGFSMGNGTSNGFIPEIIGMGYDENDPGLYFLGRSGNNKPSTVPLVVIDGRDYQNRPIKNRPIFAIKNGIDSTQLIVDQKGRVGIGVFPKIYKLEVKGSIKADDIIFDSSTSLKKLFDIVIEQQQQIDKINKTLSNLIKNL